ncbi:MULTISPECIES: PAS domain S-box protein [Haloarcula]|uniref:PAS domain S-box protein n=1 Tax=Haloarcula TaxID=2237 RepID=UPI0023EA866B|nr:PAS domain S-box protein [Halomicroarcula sp. XH51]
MDRNSSPSDTKVGLDITRDRNRELLEKLFEACDVVEFSGAVPDGTDVCIVDEAAIGRSPGRFETWQTEQSPVFAPVALLSETDDRTFGDLPTSIDSVLRIPMPKAELSDRIDNLLQMRDFSRELVAERQLTELVFESSPLAKLVLDPDGTVVRANRRAGALFESTPADLVGTKYHAGNWTAVRMDGSEIPREERALTRVLETGQSVYEYEHVISRPGEDDIWVSVNMAPILDESGGIAYVVAVLEDVTVRHTQAQERERQVDLFRKAQAIAKVGAWEYDAQQDSVYLTAEVYEILGLEPGTTLTMDAMFDQYNPADRETVRAAFRRALDDGEPYDVKLRVAVDDGAERWVRTRGEPQRENGDVVRVRGTVQDITEQKRREERLHQMTDAVDKAPIGIVLSDPTQDDNPLVYVNEGFVEVTGYEREAATGRNCRFLQGEKTDPETVARLRRKIDAEEPVTVTVRNYRADGTDFWNRVEVAPIRDESGTVVNFIGFQQDVTERVERQRQIKLLDRYLRHNILNKMNVVNGLAESIQRVGDPPVTDYATTIEEAGQTLLQNMEKEREVTKLLRSDPEPSPTGLMSLLRPVVAELADRYPDATIGLSGPESVTVTGIAALEQAFKELVDNAIEHNGSASPTVEVTVDPGPDTVSVRVADDGPGIPEMEADVLLDAGSESEVYHGKGLGLWLVYLVVTRSGGSLEFDAPDDGGGVVVVELQRADEPAG